LSFTWTTRAGKSDRYDAGEVKLMIWESNKKLLPAVALAFMFIVPASCTLSQTANLSTDEAVLAELQKRVDAKRA
jgi:hypothetical protein